MPNLRPALRPTVVMLVLSTASLLGGCAAVLPPANTTTCTLFTSLLPASATANHVALAPGNQAQFVMGTGLSCDSLQARDYPSWTNPDPIDIQISGAADNTNGTVTCKGPTAGAVALSATATVNGAVVVKTVALTCQ